MPRKPSRREFLQETAAGAVVTSLSVSSLTNSVRAQDKKTSGAPAVNTSAAALANSTVFVIEKPPEVLWQDQSPPLKRP